MAGSNITLTPTSSGITISGFTGALGPAEGGTGDTNLTGVRYANGGSPDTAATASQINTVLGTIANTAFTTSTASVSANTCNAAVQVAMPGVVTTSVFIITPSSDTSSITGWGGTGGLILDTWPTAGYFNYKVCNQTS